MGSMRNHAAHIEDALAANKAAKHALVASWQRSKSVHHLEPQNQSLQKTDLRQPALFFPTKSPDTAFIVATVATLRQFGPSTLPHLLTAPLIAPKFSP
jgi:hypothetical protein